MHERLVRNRVAASVLYTLPRPQLLTWKAFLRLMLKALRTLNPSGAACSTPSGAWNSSHILVGPDRQQTCRRE